MKILLIDDDPDLIAVTGFALQQAGYMVIRAHDGLAALEAFRREQPDLLVLDINMPRMNGFEVVKRLRDQGSRTPVLMLTVRGEEEDLVRGLEAGADDYLTKPYSPRTLLARVRALLRRAGFESEGSLEAGSLRLDLEDLTLSGLPSGPVRLTPLETRLLQMLIAQAGRTVASDRILTHVWGDRGGGDRQLLKQLVHRLRQKIEPEPADPHILQTVPSAGYRLQVPEPD